MKFAAPSLLAFMLTAALGITCAVAADQPASSAKQLTPQQQRMVDCNKQAEGKTGDDRKAFMSQCLKGGSPAAATAPTPAAKPTQQEKMKTCNADATAKGLTGDARKDYMSACLKKDNSATSSPAH